MRPRSVRSVPTHMQSIDGWMNEWRGIDRHIRKPTTRRQNQHPLSPRHRPRRGSNTLPAPRHPPERPAAATTAAARITGNGSLHIADSKQTQAEGVSGSHLSEAAAGEGTAGEVGGDDGEPLAEDVEVGDEGGDVGGGVAEGVPEGVGALEEVGNFEG